MAIEKTKAMTVTTLTTVTVRTSLARLYRLRVSEYLMMRKRA